MTIFTSGPDAQTATDAAVWQAAPQCSFYVRTQVTNDPATYRYDPVYLPGGPYGQGVRLVTPHPPAVGDLIWLNNKTSDHTSFHRVIERAWYHSPYGSANWPVQNKWTTVGPNLDIILTPDDGPIRNEAPEAEDEG
jgi:hypothetical protein